MREAAHVFISYARSSEGLANRAAEVLRGAGYSVWRDDELPAHRSYAEVIEERLKSAKAVVVLWSAEAAKSQWVRAEADTARGTGTLVQASVDGTLPPMPFNQIQCADLKDWDGATDSPGWQKLESSVAALVGGTDGEATAAAPAAVRAPLVRASVCVLPFVNMSGEPEQEYFSDGISEDITTDLSKISALEVVARNTAFSFKGQNPDVKDVAKQLSVSHVLEGSVRKAGNRIRINAQLIDGSTGKHLWADRFDRDLTDIFEIQDEISKAIVDALKVKLLPAERKAIESRGTSNVEAYNLYLMARQQWIGGALGKSSREEAIVRLCRQATQLDPDYAQAWALMALAQLELRFWHGRDEDAVPAAERALEINPGLAEAHCAKARYLEEGGNADEAEKQIRTALKLDPDSWEVNREAARMLYRHGHIGEAIAFFEKATSLMDNDWNSSMMLVPCYSATGDEAKLCKSARTAVERAERAIAQDPTNGTALGGGAYCLAMAGDEDRARDWIRRALLLDPENLSMRYNVACTLARKLGDAGEAIEALRPYLETATGATQIAHAEADPDLDTLRDDPRFKEMLVAAKQRIGMTEVS
ncbi:TIR domain-containing protein [Sphingomonas sp.]|uniref:TIR domain-containing protein n=1 Tax=Sphingomonas sp. TaxID=28214 RepID=UPI0025F9F84C|nr:TIR domain-containing protein [Sphingomonas sp.]